MTQQVYSQYGYMFVEGLLHYDLTEATRIMESGIETIRTIRGMGNRMNSYEIEANNLRQSYMQLYINAGNNCSRLMKHPEFIALKHKYDQYKFILSSWPETNVKFNNKDKMAQPRKRGVITRIERAIKGKKYRKKENKIAVERIPHKNI